MLGHFIELYLIVEEWVVWMDGKAGSLDSSLHPSVIFLWKLLITVVENQ
jgi:hypothetical protein